MQLETTPAVIDGSPAPDPDPERVALQAGLSRAAFARWNHDVAGVVRVWGGASLTIGVLLLLATWGVAELLGPEVRRASPTFSNPPTIEHAAHLFGRNSLVLAMHALICVAGYMATTSMPIVAERYTGLLRWIHLAARPFTIAFVGLITISSFALQAWTLGMFAPHVAAAYQLSVGQLLLRLTPHALPELAAMFLPLGAWLVLARRGAWSDLLAASVFASALALPVLLAAALVEVYVTPLLLGA